MSYGGLFQSNDGRMLITEGAYTYFENAIPPEVSVLDITMDSPYITNSDWPWWTRNWFLQVGRVTVAVRVYLPDGYPIESGALPMVFFRDLNNQCTRMSETRRGNAWPRSGDVTIRYNSLPRFAVSQLNNSGIVRLKDGRYAVIFGFLIQVNPKTGYGASSNAEVLDFCKNGLLDTLAFTSFIPLSNASLDYTVETGMELYNAEGRVTFSTRPKLSYSTGVPMKLGKRVKLDYAPSISQQFTMLPESKACSEPIASSGYTTPWMHLSTNSRMSRASPITLFYYKRDDRIIEVVKVYKYFQSWGIYIGGVAAGLMPDGCVHSCPVSLDVGMSYKRQTKRSGLIQDLVNLYNTIAAIPILQPIFKPMDDIAEFMGVSPEAVGLYIPSENPPMSTAPAIQFAREDSVLLLSPSCSPRVFAKANKQQYQPQPNGARIRRPGRYPH